ncbi:hypothetical protein P6U16_21550 (plasmid) [Rhizobium sp. 32-5/1]|uniref:hypothetical protein n=1 Tax=Rhizobium sp. 32-5/1 TaxID=3019602 RepID=UPI00240DE893|nr:hypothetical protein [Rhizobium sp. 32-5/1]WEZ85669.1 hypothetical protein P6U16_21550 [Rhizobium sp. 32-5/1]
MSVKAVAKSLVIEVAGPEEKQPKSGVEDGIIATEKRKAKLKRPDVKKVGTDEVQNPLYVKRGGSP